MVIDYMPETFDPTCECGSCWSCNYREAEAEAGHRPSATAADEAAIAKVRELLSSQMTGLARLVAGPSRTDEQFQICRLQFQFWQIADQQLERLANCLARGSLY